MILCLVHPTQATLTISLDLEQIKPVITTGPLNVTFPQPGISFPKSSYGASAHDSHLSPKKLLRGFPWSPNLVLPPYSLSHHTLLFTDVKKLSYYLRYLFVRLCIACFYWLWILWRLEPICLLDLLQFQHLGQCLTHSKHSVNNCWFNVWRWGWRITSLSVCPVTTF